MKHQIMAEPFFNLCILSPKLMVEFCYEMVPAAIHQNRERIQKNQDFMKAIQSFENETNWNDYSVIFTNFAPIDVSIGHEFSRIYKRDSSNSIKTSARILHIIWHTLSIPVLLACSGHRHFFVISNDTLGAENIKALPVLNRWDQLSSITPKWCME